MWEDQEWHRLRQLSDMRVKGLMREDAEDRTK